MLMNAPATFIQSYIHDLNDALNQLKPGAALTRIQAAWLGTCLTGILLMNSVCWAKFERASLGDCKVAALSWVFRKASIPWDCLLRVSVVLILKRYGITEGVLAFDESANGAPCYLTKFRDSCRRNSFTYAANRRCSSRPASATD
ncbi:hypothetical protein [Bathymodiolus japonicus methanotrophic gill symbiont]|uniref:hypothetical protein n=1 Tax=Bathymodiolus japonicus methanotrophic gill symbiont TaxID=113269 RepID=UPI001C8EF8E1|nr:hypothetical protein [Bathymodiolus japonicus methanotrophic gill symbiont]